MTAENVTMSTKKERPVRRAEFEERKYELACTHCGSASLSVRDDHNIIHPGGGVWFEECNRFQYWLGKDRAENHRPRLKSGTIDQVWDAWGSHCAHCELSREYLSVLGVGLTVQHVPPFKGTGKDEYLIPLCNWCQQDSATKMKRLETLVKRLSEKFSMGI